ncbi:MAG: YraN family protein [Bacteroidales bacterium]|nr:YraN family protein [Bacteroidales bacterium]
MDRRRITGKIGEDAVASYLISRGHTIIERNWRGGHLEVDIISLDKNGLHFVEIKTRTGDFTEAPEEKVGKIKQQRIIAAANRYLNKVKTTKMEAQEIFFDVAAVTIGSDGTTVRYFPEAYIPMTY